MKPSAKQNILSFLQENRTVYHGAELQRMTFKNKNGSSATGDTIKRRLNELVKENLIQVSYKGGEAYFSADPPLPHYPQYIKQELPDGTVRVIKVEKPETPKEPLEDPITVPGW